MGSHRATASELDHRLEEIAWGIVVFLIGVEFLPHGDPKAALVAAAGIMLLGLNAVRVVVHVPISIFSTILGAVVLATAVGYFAGVAVPGDALLVMLLGLAMVVGQLVRLRGPLAAG